MRTYLTLTRRELSGYFLSMSGYVIAAAALFMMGLSFVVLIEKLQQEPTPMPVTELFYITPFFWLILLLAAPMITMRLFAHEKFSGTFETLMTAPVSDLTVVLAKFTASLVFWLIMWVPLFACLLIVQRYTSGGAAVDTGSMAGAMLGVLLLGCVFLSLGCCASAMTRYQVTAAMISLLFGASLFLVGVLADKIPVTSNWQGQVLASLAFFEQMHDFARGIIDSRPILLYVSLTLFFLFLTLRIVESRRWK
jgi:ABC-2 type transport system permease protein